MDSFYNAIIGEIRKLYNKVSLVLLHKRIGDYHQYADSNEGGSIDDVKSTLLEYVDDIASHTKPAPKVEFSVDSIIAKQPVANTNHYEKHSEEKHYIIDHKYTKDLSRYFKSRRNAYELDSGIKGKLEHSVWEHINASIQSAHKGDRRSAKMHIDIAITAFKEVEHYMTEECFSDFSIKVNERLELLK